MLSVGAVEAVEGQAHRPHQDAEQKRDWEVDGAHEAVPGGSWGEWAQGNAA